jgi:hypothetical protein
MFNTFLGVNNTSTLGLPFFINKLGDDLTGIMLGVGEAVCSCLLLQECPTIKKIDLVDKYIPYEDYIGRVDYSNDDTVKCRGSFCSEKDLLDVFSDKTPDQVHHILSNITTKNDRNYPIDIDYFDSDEISYIFNEAKKNIVNSGYLDRVEFHIMDTNQFLDLVPDESCDFIFLDAHLTYNQIYSDLEKWIPKVKTGGIVSGHDYMTVETFYAVKYFREKNNIKDKMYRVHNDAFLWFKGIENGISGLKK